MIETKIFQRGQRIHKQIDPGHVADETTTLLFPTCEGPQECWYYAGIGDNFHLNIRPLNRYDALSIKVRNVKPESTAQHSADLHTEIEKLLTEVAKTLQPHTNKIFLFWVFAIGVLTGAAAQAITEALS